MQTELWCESALLATGWADAVRIDIVDGRITAVTPGAPPGAGERHGAVIPGLANLHSHAFQRGMAGLTETGAPVGETDNFWTWRELMYSFLASMGPEDVEAVAAQAYVEMLESGFTRVGEFHYLHHQPDGTPYDNPAELATRIAAASATSGIGLTLLPCFYTSSGFGGAPCTPGQRRFATDIDRYAMLLAASRQAVAGLADARVGIAPHSLRAAPIDALAEVLTLTQGGPVHIHVAEQMKEVADCLAWSGRRPVDLLLDRAPVDETWCLIHATHVTPEEVSRIAASGAVAGLCPITEADLGDGVFPAASFLGGGGSFGVGTDSNVAISAPGELRMLEYAQRLTALARNVLAPGAGGSTGRRLFDAALAGGNRALGVSGGIVVGASADFVSLSRDLPALAGRRGDRLLDSWVFAPAAGMVDCVWRDGRKMVIAGRHVAHAAVGRRFAATMTSLLA